MFTEKIVLESSFLKWAGGKKWLIKKLPKEIFASKKILIEPFVGSAAFFLNSTCEQAYLSDINGDLINTYQWLKEKTECLILAAQKNFSAQFNCSEHYYKLRERFNSVSHDSLERAALFIYLNRHGYNGLCRYNRLGIFNVPFGRYERPYFPEKEMRLFAQKSKNAFFFCESFEESFFRAETLKKNGDQDFLIYCDPPYAPLKQGTYFPGYSSIPFRAQDQMNLAAHADAFRNSHQETVLISNHSIPESQKWYQKASFIQEFLAPRRIGRTQESRQLCKELIAAYLPNN